MTKNHKKIKNLLFKNRKSLKEIIISENVLYEIEDIFKDDDIDVDDSQLYIYSVPVTISRFINEREIIFVDNDECYSILRF